MVIMSFDCSALSVRQGIHAPRSVEIFPGPLPGLFRRYPGGGHWNVVSEIDTIVSSQGQLRHHLAVDQMTLFDTSVPWITLWQSDLSIRIRIAPPASEGYPLFSVVPLGTTGPVNPRRGAVCLLDRAGDPPTIESTRSVMIDRAMDHLQRLTVIFRVNPRRGASGFCGLKLWTWSPYHHQRVAVNGHICSQVVDIVVMDLVQNTAMCAVLRNQGLEVQSILMDHILCRRRFAVPAGVDVISIPTWNSFAFQSVVQEFQCPAQPAQTVEWGGSPQGRAGNPNCLSSSSLEIHTVRTIQCFLTFVSDNACGMWDTSISSGQASSSWLRIVRSSSWNAVELKSALQGELFPLPPRSRLSSTPTVPSSRE